MSPAGADVPGHREKTLEQLRARYPDGDAPGHREKTIVNMHLRDKKEILDSFDENAILILCIWNRIHIFTDRMEEKCREQEL